MKDVHKKTLQARLKELRISSGRTQEEIANELFCSRTSLSNYESGRRIPSIEVLSQLAEYFNVDIGYLLTGKPRTRSADNVTPQSLTDFKYLIKERYLDLSGLSDKDKAELLNYYRYLKFRESQEKDDII